MVENFNFHFSPLVQLVALDKTVKNFLTFDKVENKNIVILSRREMLIYTRFLLILAALGLLGSGIAATANLLSGKSALVSLLTLLLVVGISYFWVKDWKQIGKCASLEK